MLVVWVVMDVSDDLFIVCIYMLVLVVIDGVVYSVDVGFGGNMLIGLLWLD